MCADLDSKPHLPIKYKNYDVNRITFNNLPMNVLYGRSLRYRSQLALTRHQVYFLHSTSPLCQMAAQYAHQSLGCCHGKQAYVNFINMVGFHAVNIDIDIVVKEVTDRCQQCPLIQFLWKAKSPLESALCKKR